MKKNIDIRIFCIYILSFIFIFFAIYFHNGYFYLINEVIYSDYNIPESHQNDLYYFHKEKLLFKNVSAAVIFVLSVTLFLFTKKEDGKIVRFVLFLQLIIVLISVFRWFLFQGFILG